MRGMRSVGRSAFRAAAGAMMLALVACGGDTVVKPTPPPPQPPVPTGFAGGPQAGYDSPPGYGAPPSPAPPRYESIGDQGGRDESYGFRNYPK